MTQKCLVEDLPELLEKNYWNDSAIQLTSNDKKQFAWR